MKSARFAIALAAILPFGLVSARTAQAQLHWDVGAEVGAMRRVLSSRAIGTEDAGIGPIGEIHGHVALLPLVRVGAYLGHDISPQGNSGSRQITFFGARVKVNSPWPHDPWRAYFFAGFGYAAVYAPSYHTSVISPGATGMPAKEDALVDGVGGHFFEIPLGIGIAYKVRKPLEITAELSGRFGFGFGGDLYDLDRGRVGSSPSQIGLLVDNPGNDAIGVSLMLGVNFDL